MQALYTVQQIRALECAAAARLEGTENIGFAIAIDEALPVIAEIRRRGGARLWIGAAIGSVESDAAAVRLGLDPSTRGVVVTEVFEGGPAARAQLAVGDVIVRLDDEEIRSEAAFVAALERRKVGSRVVLELIDSAGPRRASVTLARRPETPAG